MKRRNAEGGRRKSGQWPVVSDQSRAPSPPSAFRLPPSAPPLPSPLSSLPSPAGFTLVELLVTITIIGMLAAMMLGGLHAAGNIGKEAATKATIAKLNGIIMQRYESYMTRRVPIQILPGTPPSVAALNRLNALRDLMWLEMPDHMSDIDGTNTTYTPSVTKPALWNLYNKKYTSATYVGTSGAKTNGLNCAREMPLHDRKFGQPRSDGAVQRIGDRHGHGRMAILRRRLGHADLFSPLGTRLQQQSRRPLGHPIRRSGQRPRSLRPAQRGCNRVPSRPAAVLHPRH